MSKLPFRRFLRTGDAIQIHVVCLLLIVVLSWSLVTGNAQPDYKYGLLFAVIVYPVLLVLSWWSQRLDPIVTTTARPVDVPRQVNPKNKSRRNRSRA
jgi:hypothetical protein